MPTIFSGVEKPHRPSPRTPPRTTPKRPPGGGRLAHPSRPLTTTVNALNEANEALDTKANAALALSLLAATVSLIALKRR